MAANKYVAANLTFMAHDPLHDTHKPYELLYNAGELPTGCNFDEMEHEVVIEDFRPLKGKLSLDREGFLLADLDSTMTYQDFFDEAALKDKYMSEVKALILNLFQARSVYFHECVVGLNLGAFDSGAYRDPDSEARSNWDRI